MYSHHGARVRRMDHLAVADVNAHMVRRVTEENQIARLFLTEWHVGEIVPL
jgi:hypothetical protein